jgi:hypothetical protein
MTNDRAERIVNAQPWEPLPGMVKLQCDACRFFFASHDPAAELCPDCMIRVSRRRAKMGVETSATWPKLRETLGLFCPGHKFDRKRQLCGYRSNQSLNDFRLHGRPALNRPPFLAHPLRNAG